VTRKPFFRAFDGCWYAQTREGGKRKQKKLLDRKGEPIRGREREAEAWKAFHREMAQDPANVPDASRLAVAHVCDLFLSHAEKHNDARTFAWYRKFLQSFCELWGGLPALAVLPTHVSRWLDSHPGWTTSRRCAVTCVKRAYNWAESEGLLNHNPMKRVKKPAPVRRDRILTPGERAEILAAIKDQEFRDFVFALQETGCRPGEVRKVTAEDVNLQLGVWVLQHHKTRKKTGLPRVVYLTPGMIELCKRLVERWPEGPIFRGPRRWNYRPFSRNAIRCRFRRLRAKLPQLKGVISYTYRHSYITDALERGVSAATVAELAGHKDLTMLQAHYVHLSEKRKHLAEAARKAAGYDAARRDPPQARA
jgi:integrase